MTARHQPASGPPPGRRGDVARGVAALIWVPALLVGVPIVLAVAVGWPLPTAVPSLDRVIEVLDGRRAFDVMIVVKTLTVVAWLAWAELAVAVTVDGLARLRTRPTPTLPGLGPFQACAASFFAGVALVVSTDQPLSAPAMPITAAHHLAAGPPVQAAEDTPAPQPPAIDDTVPPVTTPPAPVVEHTVQPREHLWGLAQRYLAPGGSNADIAAAVQIIYDANAGRPQPDGQALANPSRLRPGWILHIPNPAMPATPAPPSLPPQTHAVEPGDHLWGIAERALTQAWGQAPTDEEIDPYWRQVVEANRSRLQPPHDPNVIYPGQELVLPPAPPDPNPPVVVAESPPGDAPAPPPAGHAPEPTTAVPATSEPTSRVEPDRPGQQAPTDDDAVIDEGDTAGSDPATAEAEPGAPSAVGLFGAAGTVLAAGVLASLRVRRRRRAVTLAPGTMVPSPPPQTAGVHAEATWAADEPRVDWLERALRHLAASVAPAPGKAWPRPLVVQAGDRWIDVLLREPLPRPPPPWRSEASGRVWQWDRDVDFDLPEPDPDRWAPLPGLVTLGAHDDDGSLLLLDIEAEGVIGLTGDPDAVQGLARSIVLELACTPLREAAAVFTMVGFDVPGADALQHVRLCPSFDEVSGELRNVAHGRREGLDRINLPNTFAARAAGNLDMGAPDIVVLGAPPDDSSFAQLCQLLGDRRGGVAVICVGWCPSGAFPIEVDPDRVRLPTLGLAARAQHVGGETAARIGELVDSPDGPAEQVEEPHEVEEPQEAGDTTDVQPTLPLDIDEPAAPGLDIDSYDDRPYHVLVRLLAGPPTVLGETHLPPKHTAALAYIALHHSVTVDKLRDAVWGGKPVSPKTVRNVLNKLRELLPGAISDVCDGRVTAGPDLATDVELFERRIAYARRQPASEACATLKGALELVRDQPFAYLGRNDASYRWVDHENWGSRWEAKVVDAADRLADLHLAAGDCRAARWAAERGLAVSPANRQLTRQLILAYGRSGQPEVASRVADEYERVIEELGVDDEDGDSLRDVAAALAGRRPKTPAGDAG